MLLLTAVESAVASPSLLGDEPVVPAGAVPPLPCCCVELEEGSYFLGLPRDRCRRFMNSASSTIQKEPKSSSYRTKHLCSDRLVRMAFYTALLSKVDEVWGQDLIDDEEKDVKRK